MQKCVVPERNKTFSKTPRTGYKPLKKSSNYSKVQQYPGTKHSKKTINGKRV